MACPTSYCIEDPYIHCGLCCVKCNIYVCVQFNRKHNKSLSTLSEVQVNNVFKGTGLGLEQRLGNPDQICQVFLF